MKNESVSKDTAAGEGTPLPTRIITYLDVTPPGVDPMYGGEVKKAGWYETDSLDGRPMVNKGTRLLNKTELKKHGLDHNVPPKDMAEAGNPDNVVVHTNGPEVASTGGGADVAADAKKIHEAAVGETLILCEATKREGGDPKVATHLVTLHDGTQEYRHISKLGPKSRYRSAVNIDRKGNIVTREASEKIKSNYHGA